MSCVIGGKGPVLMLIHGYPQSGFMWHKVAVELSKKHTLIIPDLRGYGRSFKPATRPDHSQMSFRAMARDLVELMDALGHQSFAVCGHDRGARVAHRMALDYPKAVMRLMLLDILPTLYLYENLNQKLAMAYFHWLFLPQAAPLPETFISSDPELWLDLCLAKWSLVEPGSTEFNLIFPPDIKAKYLEYFAKADVLHCSTEDYRAGAGVDLVHDRASRAQNELIQCPSHVIWGGKGQFGQSDAVGIWQEAANGAVTGQAIDSGHFVAEERPEDIISHCLDFFH